MHAPDYDALRRRLVPCFEELYGAAVEALANASRPLRRVLDLGAGTGLLSARVAGAYPEAELVLLDASPAMLGQAGVRGTRHVADMRAPLPGGKFDAIVSALAIHHLDDPGKRDLYARVNAALAPGGVFVNAEHVAGPTDWLESRYRDHHTSASRRLGASAREWQGAQERMAFDRRTPLATQLDWLREVGFVDVDCLFKDHGFAVLFARGAGQA